MLARARTQIRHKRYADSLREKVQQSIELALVDPLTGLNNRRFLETHLATMMENARIRRSPLSLMILDIDHFKRVNDTHGHDSGDEVLIGFRRSAARHRARRRPAVPPRRRGIRDRDADVNLGAAIRIAERARLAIKDEEFIINAEGKAIPVTVSIGISEAARDGDASTSSIARADRALYRSKSEGRNRVTAHAA